MIIDLTKDAHEDVYVKKDKGVDRVISKRSFNTYRNNFTIVFGKDSKIEIGTGSLLGKLVSMENGVVIGNNCKTAQNVSVCENAKIGDNVAIDRYVSIGPDCSIGDGTHMYRKSKIEAEVIIGKGVEVKHDVKIGDNCEIGNGVVIPKGKFLEKGTKIDPIAKYWAKKKAINTPPKKS